MNTPRSRAAFSAVICATMFATVCLLTLCPDSARAQGGVPLWTNRYNGPRSGSDVVRGIAVDRDGNVFVIGDSSFGQGSSYVPNDFTTIKYSNTGQPLWIIRYTGPGEDRSGAIAVDSDGDVVVAAFSAPVGGKYDFVTIKYSNAGLPLWTNRYNGPASNDDVARAIAVDSGGNVFVVGESSTGSSYDYATIKYSSAGDLLWTRRFGPALGGIPLAIAVDSSGNVIVAGSQSGGSSDYGTIKYSGDGVPPWTNRYNGPENRPDQAAAMAVDSSGNVFVTGYSLFNATSFDYITIKYLNTGQPVWTNRYNGPGNGGDTPTAIAVDGSGNVFVTGDSIGSGTGLGWATIKYSNAGAALWTNRSGLGNARAIALDSGGNVFVTGTAPAGATVAYSNTGVALWTNLFNPGAGSGIAVDTSANIFVAGYSGVLGSNEDFVTIKYSSSVASGPSLNFQLLNNQLVLSWTNAAYFLQTTPAVPGTFNIISGATSPYTNPLAAPQQFFRLQLD